LHGLRNPVVVQLVWEVEQFQRLVLACLLIFNFSLQVSAFPITGMFGMCAVFLLLAAFLQRRLMLVAEIHRNRSVETWVAEKGVDSESEPLNI
jgi:hypothetical protein